MHLLIVCLALICTKPAPIIQAGDSYPPQKGSPFPGQGEEGAFPPALVPP